MSTGARTVKPLITRSHFNRFMLECEEVNYIVQNASNTSLILVDEFGRGLFRTVRADATFSDGTLDL